MIATPCFFSSRRLPMLPLSKLLTTATIFFALLCATASAAHAQSRIYGTLEPIRSYGPCGLNRRIPTDNSVSRATGLWFMWDRSDRTVSSRGLEMMGPYQLPFPNHFTSTYRTIPNTVFTYTSSHTFSDWDRRRKTVTMLKQSWMYTGWGVTTKIACYGAWVAKVQYR